jgi:hypothetical protein
VVEDLSKIINDFVICYLNGDNVFVDVKQTQTTHRMKYIINIKVTIDKGDIFAPILFAVTKNELKTALKNYLPVNVGDIEIHNEFIF